MIIKESKVRQGNEYHCDNCGVEVYHCDNCGEYINREYQTIWCDDYLFYHFCSKDCANAYEEKGDGLA